MKKILVLLILAVGLATLLSTARASATGVAASQNTVGKLTDKEAIDYSKFYIATAGDASLADMRQKIAAQLIVYAINTNKFALTLSPAVYNLLGRDEDKDNGEDKANGNAPNERASMLMIYMAGETIYLLENKQKNNSAASFVYAFNQVLDVYAKMKEHNLEGLNKFLEMSPEERNAALEESYNEAEREVKEAKNSKK